MVEEGMEEVVKQKENNFNGKYSISDYAISFVYGMGKTQRERFKEMLEQGISCGQSIASNYGVDYDELMKEVKRILDVEEKE